MKFRDFWKKLSYTLGSDMPVQKPAPIKIRHEQNALIAARHEAGHTLAAYKAGWKVTAIQFLMNGDHFVNAKSIYDEGNEKPIVDAILTYVESTEQYDASPVDDRNRACEVAKKRCFVLLGGPAAEHIYSGQILTENFGLYEDTPDKLIYDGILCFLHGTSENYNRFFADTKRDMRTFFSRSDVLSTMEKISESILNKPGHHLSRSEIENIFINMNLSFD